MRAARYNKTGDGSSVPLHVNGSFPLSPWRLVCEPALCHQISDAVYAYIGVLPLSDWRECGYRTLLCAGTCDCGNESSASIKCGEFLD